MSEEERYRRIARTMGQKASAEKVLLALSAENVPVIVLKGLTLQERIYAVPHQRIMADVDFLVRKDDFKRTEHIIQSLGYTFSPGDKGYTPEFAELYMGEVQFRKGFVYIDLHWSLTAMGWYRLTTNFDLEQMWDSAIRTNIGDALAYRLCPEHEVIHLCFHTAVHHGLSHGPGYRDILGVLRVEQDSLDWDQLTECARDWRVRTAVWSALSVARKMDSQVVPEVTLNDIRVPKWHQALLLGVISRGHTGNRVLVSGTMRFLGVLLVDRLRDLPAVLFKGLFPGRQWLKSRYNLSSGAATLRQITYPITVVIQAVKALITI